MNIKLKIKTFTLKIPNMQIYPLTISYLYSLKNCKLRKNAHQTFLSVIRKFLGI